MKNKSIRAGWCTVPPRKNMAYRLVAIGMVFCAFITYTTYIGKLV